MGEQRSPQPELDWLGWVRARRHHRSLLQHGSGEGLGLAAYLPQERQLLEGRATGLAKRPGLG